MTIGARTRAWSPAISSTLRPGVQSAAEPGTVLVGEATKRATEAAIAYTNAGEHELKGKSGQATLWQALRVVAARKGEGRFSGLEPLFVGRERELRMAKELFHATATEGRAHLLSIVGVPGMGKSRLAWEFEKYIDGVLETAWWHKGRCLAYGEGVAYWALAEMIRMRARIAEEEACGRIAIQALLGRVRDRRRSGGARLRRATAPASPGGSRTASRPIARTSSRRGGSSSSEWPIRTR